jgi:hypothetical protein
VAIANSKAPPGAKAPPNAKAALEAKLQKKKNLATAKLALRIAAIKTKSGKLRWVGFAFSPGKSKAEHMLKIDVRKKGTVLMKELKTLAKDRKDFCCGVATVTKVGRPVLWLKYIKRLSGVERKIQEALVEMKLRYLVKMRRKKDDDAYEAAQEAEEERIEEDLEEELETTAEEHEEVEDLVGQDDDLDELETAALEEEDEDEQEEGEEEEGEEAEEAEEEGETAEAEAESANEDDKKREPDDKKVLAKLSALRLAPQVWQGTHRVLTSSMEKLKDAIKSEYAGESTELVAEIEKNIGKIDRILEKLDSRLAESMERAHRARDETERKAELAIAKTLLKEQLAYVSSEPLIAHIDSNPFGVATNLKATLTRTYSQLAKTIS